MTVRLGSLFSGIGGLELGLTSALVDAGIRVEIAWQVEKDEFCRTVLRKHWPHVNRNITDVAKASAATLAPVDAICGGFPCQDISYAGKGAGLAGERSGLWFEFARIVREMGPRFVVVENVAAFLTRGLDAVLGTLADIGYDAQWYSLRASDVGAPHQRDRVFIVANANPMREPQPKGRQHDQRGDGSPSMGDPDVSGLEGRQPERSDSDERSAGPTGPEGGDDGKQDGCPQPGMGGVPHGISYRLDRHRWPAPPGETQYEGEPPRTIKGGRGRVNLTPEERHARRYRVARIKGLGNAVVPQQGYAIGQILAQLVLTDNGCRAVK